MRPPIDTALAIGARANARMADLLEWLARDPNALGNATVDRLVEVQRELDRLTRLCRRRDRRRTCR